MMLRRASAIGLSLLTIVTMTGRTGGDRMTLDEAREMTDAVMCVIVDKVPDGAIEDMSADSPYRACGDNSYTYSARWGVTPQGAFSGVDFVRDLPAQLGTEFVVAEGMVDVSYPAVALNHTSGVVLDVSIAVLESEKIVEVYAISPCAIGELPR